jgi:acyl dehydratase
VILALVLQALGEHRALAERVGATPRIDQAKFLAPVGPGAVLRVVLRAGAAGVAFEVLSAGASVARGQIGAGA